MRPLFIKSAVAAALCSPFVLQVSHASDWNGSYSAQGQCYCAGELPASLSVRVVPTPIGGQTISQVCERVGEGPELRKASGLFNHPVYNDAQCGHGPFAAGSAAVDMSCAGSLDGDGEQCQKPGPKWDLATAYGKKKSPAAALPEVKNDESSQGLIDKPLVTSVNVENTVDKVQRSGEKKVLKATVIRSPSTAGNSFDPAKPKSTVKSANAKAIEAFTGKTITIDGQRYLQANSDVSANGGEPGSKIILDDLVYLREDDQLDVTELFQNKKEKAPVEPIVDKATQKTEQLSAENQTIVPSLDKKPVTSQGGTEQKIDKLAEAAVREAHKQRQISANDAGRQSDKSRLSESQPLAEQKQPRQKRIELVEDPSSDERAQAQALLAKQAEDAAKLKLRQEEAAALKARQEELAARRAEAEQLQKDEKARLQAAEKARLKAVDETTSQVKPAGSTDSKAVANSEATSAGSTFSTALRLPPDTRQSSRDFTYLEALPVSYDVGGNGLLLEGSASSHTRFQYVGSLGLATDYQEVMIGGGYYLTPAHADRLTVVLLAGLEYGSFELSDEQLSVDFDDSGIYLGASTRFVLNDRFELKGGVGYSTFFEGDATIFGGGYYHINRRLDVVSRFELGDNDLLGIGVRFYY